MIIDLDSPLDGIVPGKGAHLHAAELVDVVKQLQALAVKAKAVKAQSGSHRRATDHSRRGILLDGPRGIGKTTFLRSVEAALAKPDEWGLPTAAEARIAVLPLLDPTLIDGDRVFIATVIANILGEVEACGGGRNPCAGRHTDAYQQVFKRLHELHDGLRAASEATWAKSFEAPIRDPAFVERLLQMARGGIQLADHFEAFAAAAAASLGVDMFVQPLDDVDIAGEETWTVLEAVRRYLTGPSIVPLVAGDAGQYVDTVIDRRLVEAKNTLSMAKEVRGVGLDRAERVTREIATAHQYMDKIFDPRARVGLRGKLGEVLKGTVTGGGLPKPKVWPVVPTAYASPAGSLLGVSELVLFPNTAQAYRGAVVALVPENSRMLMAALGVLARLVGAVSTPEGAMGKQTPDQLRAARRAALLALAGVHDRALRAVGIGPRVIEAICDGATDPELTGLGLGGSPRPKGNLIQCTQRLARPPAVRQGPADDHDVAAALQAAGYAFADGGSLPKQAAAIRGRWLTVMAIDGIGLLHTSAVQILQRVARGESPTAHLLSERCQGGDGARYPGAIRWVAPDFVFWTNPEASAAAPKKAEPSRHEWFADRPPLVRIALRVLANGGRIGGAPWACWRRKTLGELGGKSAPNARSALNFDGLMWRHIKQFDPSLRALLLLAFGTVAVSPVSSRFYIDLLGPMQAILALLAADGPSLERVLERLGISAVTAARLAAGGQTALDEDDLSVVQEAPNDAEEGEAVSAKPVDQNGLLGALQKWHSAAAGKESIVPPSVQARFAQRMWAAASRLTDEVGADLFTLGSLAERSVLTMVHAAICVELQELGDEAPDWAQPATLQQTALSHSILTGPKPKVSRGLAEWRGELKVQPAGLLSDLLDRARAANDSWKATLKHLPLTQALATCPVTLAMVSEAWRSRLMPMFGLEKPKETDWNYTVALAGFASRPSAYQALCGFVIGPPGRSTVRLPSPKDAEAVWPEVVELFGGPKVPTA